MWSIAADAGKEQHNQGITLTSSFYAAPNSREPHYPCHFQPFPVLPRPVLWCPALSYPFLPCPVRCCVGIAHSSAQNPTHALCACPCPLHPLWLDIMVRDAAEQHSMHTVLIVGVNLHHTTGRQWHTRKSCRCGYWPVQLCTREIPGSIDKETGETRCHFRTHSGHVIKSRRICATGQQQQPKAEWKLQGRV